MNINNKYDVLLSNWEVINLTLSLLLKKYKKTILYFYPKDNTPWCSIENKDFSSLKSKFNDLWIWIIWVSKDSIDSHKNFTQKQQLELDLISDPDLILHKELWTYWEKNNYWKIVKWVIRSTFIVDDKWNILKEYRNVRAKWHAERVLKSCKKIWILNSDFFIF